MKVLIEDHCRSLVRTYAEAAYPVECCGFLLGETDAGGRRVLRLAVPAVNEAAEHGLADRYHIAPRDYLRADRDARSRGWDILGIYHSHPDAPAAPSRTDLALGWPNYIYLIAPVHGGVAGEPTAWVLDPYAPEMDGRFQHLSLDRYDDGST